MRARVGDSGSQSQLRQDFPTCGRDEHVILELHFPDCWDGVHLDSANHKSHMAYSGGANATCPADHPVKVPQIVFEVWYYGVTGSGLSFSSGGPYTFHGDVFSAWDPRAAAGLVDECLNKNVDCTPLRFDQISMAAVTQAQIDAQLAPGAAPPPAAPAPSSPDPGSAGHDHAAAPAAAPGTVTTPGGAASTAAAAPATARGTSSNAPDPTAAERTTAAGSGPVPARSPGAAAAIDASAHSGHTAALADTGRITAASRPSWPVGVGLAAGAAGLGAGSFVLWRRRPR